jgi:hypothetical protein
MSANIAVASHGTYTYRVKAQKANYDTSDWTVGSTANLVHLACGKPGALTVPASNSTGTFMLTWSASDVSGATYIVEQSKDGGPFIEVFSGTNMFANIAVSAHGTYTYRVKAQKTNYDSSDYDVGVTSCAVHLACGKPGALTVPASNSTGTFVLSWGASDVSSATYIVEQSMNGGPFTVAYSGTNTSAFITVSAHGSYTYRVKAQKTNYDSSDWAVGSTANLVHLACGKPGSLTVPASNSTGTFVLSWSASDVSGVTYVVEQSMDGGAFTVAYSGTNTSAYITVPANGTYTYRVKAQKTNYDTSDWTAGSSTCFVRLLSEVRISVSGYPDLFFSTISAAMSGMTNGRSIILNTWKTTFIENIDLDKPDTILTIGSAFDSSYTTQTGPTVVRGTVKVTSGTLVAENLVIL